MQKPIRTIRTDTFYRYGQVLASADGRLTHLYLSLRDGRIDGAVHFAVDASRETTGNLFLLLGASTEACMELLRCCRTWERACEVPCGTGRLSKRR